MDRAQAAAARKSGGRGPEASRYSNGRYGRDGIHAHHGPSHNGKRR